MEDNPSLRDALKMGLGLYGFEVIMASHGIDALMQFEVCAGNFDAIVTDHDMPQMNGREFVRAVREMGFTGRIIVLSGHFRPEDLRAYQNHAISGFFQEPFEISLLAAMLSQVN